MKTLLTIFSIAGLSLTSAFAAAVQSNCDVDAGKKQFNKCAACHSTETGTHMMGPSLYGLMGRKAGTADGFTFSYAMEQAGFKWTEEILSDFLKSPMQYVPGTSMPFGGIKNDSQREALTCYIKNLQ